MPASKVRVSNAAFATRKRRRSVGSPGRGAALGLRQSQARRPSARHRRVWSAPRALQRAPPVASSIPSGRQQGASITLDVSTNRG